MKECLVQQDGAAQCSLTISLGESATKGSAICAEHCRPQLSDGRHSEASNFVDLRIKEDVGDRPALQTGKLDAGLWLLHGIFPRRDSWERLGSLPQGTFGCLSCLSARRYHVIKRSCDVVGSLFVLIVLFPLGLIVAILIKFDSSGPVLFRHHRVGRDGKHFVLWKFRSMRTDVPKYGISPQSAADERLTRIGRLIRRLSIDELPQLINVLRGDMSLVGPRPEMPFIVDGYRPFERERLATRPGLTGLWQISPARAFPIHDNLQYDLHYIHNQNLLLDCAIILRTIVAVVHGIGAV
jgi:lipopolysaccharide/colanic/teichoic acid biosynthesis glycosyltransferase